MRMKKYLGLFLIFTSIVSCEKEITNTNENPDFFWSPVVKIEKGDKEATIYLTDPRPFTEYYPFPPSNPDYFDIYYSDNLSSFSKSTKVKFYTTKFNITNLNNDVPYYFFVTSNKKNFDPFISDTLMTIPSFYQEPAEFSPNLGFSIERVSLSHDNKYFSFISNNGPDKSSSKNILYYKSVADGSIGVIEQNTFNANWSPSHNKVAYLSYINAGNRIYPEKMKTFDVDSKLSTTLFGIDYDKYSVFTPVFSNDGKLLSFLSSENSSEKEFYDIWTIDSETKTKTRISDFESIGFNVNGSFVWAPDGKDIYLSGYFDSGRKWNEIYKFNILTRGLTHVMESHWGDNSPSVSPDGSKIAFISGRTGKNEIWVFNILSGKYSQITGNPDYYFDSRYSNILWACDNELLLSVYKENSSKAVKFYIR
jgi:hypothetical protein